MFSYGLLYQSRVSRRKRKYIKKYQDDNKSFIRAPEKVHLLALCSATLLQYLRTLNTDQYFHGGKHYVNFFYAEAILDRGSLVISRLLQTWTWAQLQANSSYLHIVLARKVMGTRHTESFPSAADAPWENGSLMPTHTSKNHKTDTDLLWVACISFINFAMQGFSHSASFPLVKYSSFTNYPLLSPPSAKIVSLLLLEAFGVLFVFRSFHTFESNLIIRNSIGVCQWPGKLQFTHLLILTTFHFVFLLKFSLLSKTPYSYSHTLGNTLLSFDFPCH